MMRFLIAACLVLSCGLCLADDFPKNTNEIKSLTAEQAADFVMVVTHVRRNEHLNLKGLTSIYKDVARELAKFKKGILDLKGLTSIDKDVAQELAKFKKGRLWLRGLASIDEVSLTYLKSNKSIGLPAKYSDKK
jgi:hypothetical protein